MSVRQGIVVDPRSYDEDSDNDRDRDSSRRDSTEFQQSTTLGQELLSRGVFGNGIHVEVHTQARTIRNVQHAVSI